MVKHEPFARLAGHLHAAAVMGHNLFDDGESDAGSDFARSLGALGPVELLERCS